MTESEIFAQLFSNDWPCPKALVEYANKRHGYGGDDGYYVVTYPTDLDEYQRVVEGEFIPEGYVEINYWDGTHKALQIAESRYLEHLKIHLISQGYEALALELNHA